MNSGARLDEVIHNVKPPANLIEKPYLQAVYDEPEFIVRNIWRLEGGWHDGVPSHLKPAPEAAQAREIADLAGGVGSIVERALAKLEAHEFALASHLIDFAVAAAPFQETAHQTLIEMLAAAL